MTKDARRISRTLTLAAAQRHIIIQGEIVYAANQLHEAFFRLFNLALALERTPAFGAEFRVYDQAIAVWHVIQSDSSQRDMAVKAITTVQTALPLQPALKRIEWAESKASKLAPYRNLVAHNPIMFRQEKRWNRLVSVPFWGGHGTRPAQRLRSGLTRHSGFWRIVRDDLLSLSYYLIEVTDQIRRIDCESRGEELAGVPKTWPYKPRLRSIPRIAAIDRSMGQAAQKPRPRSRRKSSRR